MGAGVDCVYGLPTMASLLRDLANFARTDGKPIDRALRDQLGRINFSFDKHAGDQSTALISDLFSGSEEVSPTLRSVAGKLKTDAEAAPVAAVIEHLCDMADNNQLSAADTAALAQLAGELGDPGDGESLLDPSRITLSPLPGHAFRRAFQLVFVKGMSLTEKERQTLEMFVAATSNIEQLLSVYFTRFAIGTHHDRRVFLYLIWLLWAYLRIKSARLSIGDRSLQSKLPMLGGDVVSFNYTTFFHSTTLKHVKFFHGRLDEYLRLDTRELVQRDPTLLKAVDTDGVITFIKSLRLDVGNAPAVDAPAIVPPTSFKPVMSRQQLRTWLDVDDLLQQAGAIIVVGYSFATADEHFNDLLRHTSTRTRVVVVDIDATRPAQAASRTLGIDPGLLASSKIAGYPALSAGRITAISASAEDVTPELLAAALS